MFNAIKDITFGIAYGLYLTALAPKSQRDAALAKARTPQTMPQAETPQVEEKAEEVIAPEPIHIEQPEPQAEVEAPEPAATEQPRVEIDLAALDSTTLRKLCTQYSIAWRDIRGKGKHLKKDAMIFQLEQVAA
ncbi:hypothetical protein NDI37_25490 [Funiculus sociatus GB2-A5]|uniref:Rho termination factor N-terminal domain-containing protein n=1 Tax=Funiculus sociatus GB2-A5 TaxID=2933946 RepID=A0ABV0JWP3_9CYAN|nr:hypothetical protein [Trichocoleus sp. FACHB-6]MBD2060677.1 hypothetical protein [Trichocoleus sp. FACHB-6]